MDKSQAAKIGAEWWTDQIRESHPQNIGDFTASALAEWARNEVRSVSSLTEQKLSIFQTCLEGNLLRMLEESDWRQSNPIWGAALRTVGVDYHPDPELAEAAKKADINELFLPMKTIMWLDPDGVKVSLGYRGEIKGTTDND